MRSVWCSAVWHFWRLQGPQGTPSLGRLWLSGTKICLRGSDPTNRVTGGRDSHMSQKILCSESRVSSSIVDLEVVSLRAMLLRSRFWNLFPVSLMYWIMYSASLVVPLGRKETKNLFGLLVKATKPIVFRLFSLCFTFVSFTALISIQKHLLSVYSHTNHGSSSVT